MRKRIVKAILPVLIAIMVCFTPVAGNILNPTVTTVEAAAKVRLSKKKLTMTIGESKTIKMKGVSKKLAKKVKWSSSKKNIATVKKGKITPKKLGKAVIRAKYKGKTYKCTVKVTKVNITVTDCGTDYLSFKWPNVSYKFDYLIFRYKNQEYGDWAWNSSTMTAGATYKRCSGLSDFSTYDVELYGVKNGKKTLIGLSSPATLADIDIW